MSNNFATPMMQQHAQIKQKYPDCIIFFRLGDFYEMFLEDAKIGAEILDITLTSRDRGKDGKIPMAGVPYHAVDSYLPRLVKAGYKVAICEQIGSPDSGGLMKREIVRVVTPGTLMTEGCLEKKENNYIFSLVYSETAKKTQLGLALADISTGEFLVQEFSLETKKEIGEVLKEFIYTYNPTECVLTSTDYNDTEILEIIRNNPSVCVNFAPENSPSLASPEKYLKTQFKVANLSSFGIEDREFAQKAGVLLLTYLSESQKSSLDHITSISLINREGFVSLDSATIQNLELFSSLRNGSKRGSLIEYLDKTQTSMGGRLLRLWVRNPLQRVEEIESRYNAIDFFVSNVNYFEKLREWLTEITDIERILGRLSVGIGNPVDLKSLEYSLQKALELREFFEAPEITLPEILIHIRDQISVEMRDLIKYLQSTIKEDPPIDPKNGGIVCTGVNTELDDLKNSISYSKDWLSKLEVQQREATGISSLKVRFNKVYGYYIEITKPNLALVPENYIRKQTMVGGERFITEELKEHEEKILSSEEKINELEYTIFLEAVKKVLEYTLQIKKAAYSIASLDCLLDFAHFGLKNDFTRPTLVSTGVLEINEGRHPVVENSLEIGAFNPNSTFVNKNNPSLLILTGPNMSGKSVYIRQVAIIVLLAQIGCFVPAKSAKITSVDKIFVRSGASDMISAGISTFMLEMLEAAYILNNATQNSLVIMDEVGRGTSTYDGISIAWAIAEYLISSKLGSKTLFATHYHELCALEEKYPKKVKNYSVLVKQNSEGSPVFMHKVVEGSAEHSYGISVAEMAGIPMEVTKNARKILQDLESRGLRVTVS
ncbi:MAG TPA: DNA mismatch repair protein MutS [candidate division WWE3 bacterium]|uniref:DNA mismatch repair protein MutS n=1 Tax=candidate division WWE3 bacterium TaxID=2053526 RepID=A0A7C1HTC3_UNCKA|nr:DNA mismatch repair protein MutS [candidate division WWE3 bacterium]